MFKRFKIITLLLFISLPGFAQEYNEDGSEKKEDIIFEKGKTFNIGFYIGSYFANKYTASIYDGYGFDVDGIRNSFENSFMYNKIIVQYGGLNGQPDLIAEALGVNHGDWFFTAGDMPTNMRYSPAFLLGLQMRYSVDNKSVILININAAKINATGNFTITTVPTANSTQINDDIKTFAIKGVEQRLMLQFGYQRIFGNTEKINCFAEAGLNITVSKFDKNEILINNLHINLTEYFEQPGYASAPIKRPVGTGLGAFAGLGVNLNMNEQFRLQLVYNPSYEGINLGRRTALKLQNAVGLRVYYKL